MSAPLTVTRKHRSKHKPERLILGDSPPIELARIPPDDTAGDLNRTFPIAGPSSHHDSALSPSGRQPPVKVFNFLKKRGGSRAHSDMDPENVESNPSSGETLPRQLPNTLPLSIPGKKKTSPTKSTSASYPVKASQLVSPGTSTSAPVCRPGWSAHLPSSEDPEGNSHHLEELLPLEHPELALKEAMHRMSTSSEEWESKCSALIILRRLGAYHPAVLLPCFHSVVLAVDKEVDRHLSGFLW